MTHLATGTATSTAGPSDFFARWLDHDTWSQWSPDTEWVRLEGPPRQGTRGVLKPRGGPRTKFRIEICDPDREYTDLSRLPGARLFFRHRVEPAPGGVRLDVRIWVEGPLSRLWARILGPGFHDSAQADLDRLVALVEDR